MKRFVIGDRFDADIIELTKAKWIAGDIADKLGISERSVRRRRAVLNLHDECRTIKGKRRNDEFTTGLCPKHVTAEPFTPEWWAQNCGPRQTVTKPLSVPSRPPRVRVADVRAAAGEVFRVPMDLMVGKSRAPSVAFARHVAMHVAIAEFEMTLRRIGRVMKRDQQSVWWANRKIKKLKEVDFDLSQKVALVANMARRRAAANVVRRAA